MDAFLLRDIIYATTSLINTEYEYQQVGGAVYFLSSTILFAVPLTLSILTWS